MNEKHEETLRVLLREYDKRSSNFTKSYYFQVVDDEVRKVSVKSTRPEELVDHLCVSYRYKFYMCLIKSRHDRYLKMKMIFYFEFVQNYSHLFPRGE